MKIPRFSILLISAAALAYEILLMRLFSIIQWHHFAYMIISLALLGYGVSGTAITLLQHRLLPHYPRVFLANLGLFGVSSVGCFLLAQQLPLNAEAIMWDWHQYVWLLGTYVLLAAPFFFAANAVALSLIRYPDFIGRIYSMDLAGAGLGSAAIVLVLCGVFPAPALLGIAALALIAGLVACWELALPLRQTLGFMSLALVLALVLVLLPAQWLDLRMSPYKALPQALHINGTRVLSEYSSPLGLLSVVESPQLPWRYAPGMSITSTSEPPAQLAVFTDGDAMTAINISSGDAGESAYLDQMTSALPYHLAHIRHVLVLGAGGGSEILQARYHQAKCVDAVELNPQMAALLEQHGFSAGRLQGQDIRLHVDEARGFVAHTDQTYDLIQVALLDAFNTSAAGLHALNESYLYTVEALHSYMQRVAAGGYLAVTRWVKNPPRDTLKLVVSAIDALREQGVALPGKHLILIRNWQTSTLLVKNGPVNEAEIEALRRFCAERAFDVAYYPGIRAQEVNRFNVLKQPYFYQGVQAMLGEGREAFLRQYKFQLHPATDDRPYFFHFFKWGALDEMLQLRGQGGAALFEWGYLMLLATLLQALVLSVVLILAPLRLRRHAPDGQQGRMSRLSVLGYFVYIGLAFLFVEMAFIQKFILFLHHPLYAAAVVLSAFLLFAGLGSRYSHGIAAVQGRYRLLRCAVAGIVVLGGGYMIGLGYVFACMSNWPLLLKIGVSIGLIAPLSFCMGMPFPLGMSQVAAESPHMLPWAWAVNGCASVSSAILATLLAIECGFSAVVVCALLLYLAALLHYRAWAARPAEQSRLQS